jgi:hypothetical protein
MKTETKKLKVLVEKPTDEKLKSLGVSKWGIWIKEPSDFGWHYDEQEMCYFLEGEVTVDSPDGPVHIGKGDFVTFPRGLSCTWHIKRAVKKYYQFG